MPWTRAQQRTLLLAVLLPTIAAAAAAIFTLHSRLRTYAPPTAPVQRIAAAPAEPASQPIQPQTQPPTNKASFDPDDASTFAALADAVVAELRDGITLQQWTESQQTMADWKPSKEENFFDCRTFVKTETLPSGRQIQHFVYFYPPQASAIVAFPSASADNLLYHDCTLAMVRVATTTPTDLEGHAFEQALQQQFVQKYGASIGMKGTPYERSTEAAHWIAGSEIISVYDPQPRPSEDNPDEPVSGEVFALARLPIVHEIDEDACCRIRDHYHSIEDQQFQRALSLTAADANLTDRVATLFKHLFRRISAEPMTPQQADDLETSRAAVLPSLREWLKSVNSLPPVRHAAALYVADRMLIAASDDGWRDLIDKDKTELRLAFGKLGAEFAYDELGGCYGYSGAWLDQASELDPDGPVGQMSMLISLERGGAPKLAKDKSGELDIFHTVISDGEWLLSKKPDAATQAQVHFIIGDAYADIVALAGGVEPDYGDAKDYQPEAPSARHNALEHYRAGLAIDGTSDNAKYAWLQAWKISAGLMPSTRYVYIYD
jgi:hypothetical protein